MMLEFTISLMIRQKEKPKWKKNLIFHLPRIN